MLLTRKQLQERRSALKAEAAALLAATKDREFTPEERSSRERIEKEMICVVADEQEAEARDKFSALAQVDPLAPPKRYNNDASKDNPMNRFAEFRMNHIIAHARKREGFDSLKGIEGEIHQEMEKEWRAAGSPDSQNPANGIWLPHELPCGRLEARSTDITGMAGSLTTQQEVTLIDVLRNTMVARQAGCRLITGLSGTYEIPKKTLANTARWVGESPSLVLTDMTSGKITFTPHTVTAATRITHRLEEQTSYDVRMEGNRDIAFAIALAGDQAVFHGSGSSSQPAGIHGHSGVRTIALGTNGAAPSWSTMVECKSRRNRANAGFGTPKWVTSSMGLGKLETTAKVSGQTEMLCEDGRMLNYPVLESNQILDNLDKGSATDTLTMLVFGDFSQVVIATWGAVKLVIDPYTVQPDTILSIYQTMDVQIINPEALSKVVDLLWTP